jgi:hypothetical protein
MTQIKITPHTGTYWRLMWSKDWYHRHPWSLDGCIMPYIGGRISTHADGVAFRTLGPLALVKVAL